MNNALPAPRLVHIAVRTEDPTRLGEFYENVFDMKIVLNGKRAVDLWDGNLFLALNPLPKSGERGIDHFGFLIGDVKSMQESLKEAGASTEVEPRPRGRSFADWRVHDPEGNPIDLSERGYDTVPADRLQRSVDERTPEIRRLIIFSEDPAGLSAFYKSALRMEVARQSGDRVVLTDGIMDLVLLSREPESHGGLSCFGFCVRNRDRTFKRLDGLGIAVSSEPDRQDPNRLQYRFRDPDGNSVTLIET